MASSWIEWNSREHKDYLLLEFLWFPSNKTHFSTDPSLWQSTGVKSTIKHFVFFEFCGGILSPSCSWRPILLAANRHRKNQKSHTWDSENPSLRFSRIYRQTMYYTAQGMKNNQPPLSTETYSGLIHDTNQQNAQKCSLDTYIMKSLWIFLLVVVCNELSSGN